MRTLHFVNLALVLMALVLLEGLVSVALDRPSLILAGRSAVRARPHQKAFSWTEPKPVVRRVRHPPLADFAAVVDRDMFRSPFPPPPPRSPSARQPAAPARPLPVLVGTIFVDTERKAVLRERNRTEVYTVGQTVAGGTIMQIEADRILIERDGTQSELRLMAPEVPVPRASRSAIRTPRPLPRRR
jgi:hypothetical protein